MAFTERLALVISANPNDAVRGLQKLETTAAKTARNTEARLDRMGQRFTQVGAGMLAAGGVAAVGLLQAARSAADLEQAVGGTEAVFDEATGTIDQYARGAARSMGLSETAFRVATTGIGGQLKRMGLDLDDAAARSVELTGTAADLAATYGGTTAEAVEALGAAFRGEADPAERFNLNLKAGAVNAEAVALGLAESASEVDEYARAQAILSLITKQSADAQGQFAREQDTATAQLQIASAEFENFKALLGQGVAPILADSAGFVSGLARSFTELPDPVQDTVGTLAALTTGTLLVGGATSTLVGQLIKMRSNLSKIPAVAGGALAGVALLTVAWMKYVERQADASARAQEFTDAIQDQTGEMDDNVRAVVADRLASSDLANAARDAGASFADLGDAVLDGEHDFAGLRDSIYEAVGGMTNATVTAGQMEGILADAGLAGSDLGDNLMALAESGEFTGQELLDLSGELNRLSDDYRKGAEAADRTTTAQEDLGVATEDAGVAMLDAEEAARAYEEAMTAIKTATENALGTQLSLEEAILNSQEAMQTYTETLNDGEASARDREQAGIDLLQAYLDEGEAAREAAEISATASGRAASAEEEGAAAQIAALDRLAATLSPGNPLRSRLEAYIRQLENIPTDVTTNVTTVFSRAGSGGVNGRNASGGMALAGRAYIVGEGGGRPGELFVPSSSGRVMPIGAGMASGGEPVVVENHIYIDGQEVEQARSRYVRKNGSFAA